VHRQALFDRLADIRDEIDEIRRELPLVNDETLRPRVEELMAAAAAVVPRDGAPPQACIADLLLQLQSASRALRVPAEDPDLGVTQTLRTLRAAQGRMRSAIDDALDAAHAMHLPERPIPAQPESVANLPLPALLKRLEDVEQKLDVVAGVRVQTNVVQQRGLLNVYVDTMRLELLLARLHLKIGGEAFDFGALLRAAEAMTEATADFLATIRSWRDRLSNTVSRAAEGMSGVVRRVASGVRKLGTIVTIRAQRAERLNVASNIPVPEMVLIPPGSFVMGVPEAESARERSDDSDARPLHEVTFEWGFWLGKYPVTRGEFAAFVADTGYDAAGSEWREPGFPQTERDPVVNVSAFDAEAYVAWLSHKTGRTYRLPSEAEWEYAARAGTTTARFWGDSWGAAPRHLAAESRGTYPVGGFRPNAFGLYDVLGNVWEWVTDPWHDDYAGAPKDGSAWMRNRNERRRVLRGGSWDGNPGGVRAGVRSCVEADSRINIVGFRLARTR
jgi:formylglycine-generating enzyme required for sulfatase activity